MSSDRKMAVPVMVLAIAALGLLVFALYVVATA